MQINIEQLISGLAGTGMIGVLARMYIAHALKKLESSLESIASINVELGRISERLKSFEKSQDLIHELERRVISIECHISKSNQSPFKGDRPH